MKLFSTLSTTAKRSLATIWQAHADNARNTTVVDLNETLAQQQQRIAALEADPEQWFTYYFPKYAYADPASFHKAATARIVGNPEWYEVRMWSRELAKSTRTMMEVFYLTLTGHSADVNSIGKPQKRPMRRENSRDITQVRRKKKYVILISNSFDNAVRLLLPYKANLEFNQRIIHDYGIQDKPGSWGAEEFITRRGVAFRAIGAGQSPRGTRNEEARPDIILFDDVDTDQDCLNATVISKKWKWIEEAAIGTRSISNPTTIIFCGNRIAPDCCVIRAIAFADHTDTINIRDEHNVSSWPQKNSEEDIDRVLKQKSYAAQQKEYFNNPVIEGAVFKKLNWKPARPLRDYEMLVCYTDPSYKATSDYKATVLLGRYMGEYHIIKAFVAQTTTGELINWHYRIMDLTSGCACYYYIEEVFMQDVIKKEIADAGKRHQRPIPINGDTRAKPDKYMRIESLLEPMNRNGELFFNEDQKADPGMALLAEQFLAFAPGSRTHDDGPDAVEGGIWIMANRHTTSLSKPVMLQRPENRKRY